MHQIFLITFNACTTSVRSSEPTWCIYFISNAPFFFTFLLLCCARILPSTVPASSPSLFDLHLHLILFPLVCDVESFDLNGSIFDFKSVWAPFPLKLCAHSFSSIFFAFTDVVIVLSICSCFMVLVGFVWPIWVRLCCWFWRHHCGFGFGITTALQEVCFYLLWNGRTICVECLSISLECLFKLKCFGRMFDVCFWRMFNYMLNVWSMFYNLFEHCSMIEMLLWLECLNGLCV